MFALRGILGAICIQSKQLALALEKILHLEGKKMKKSHLMLIALVVLCAAVVSVQAHTCCAPYTTDLVAGGGNCKSAIDVGAVQVCNDAGNLYVTYVTTGGWCLLETHLHIFEDDTEFADVPHKNGNPIPGHFDYSAEHDCVTRYTYTILLDEWDPANIAAHAVVKKTCTCQEETAWGDDFCTFCNDENEFPGNNWARYFTYIIQGGGSIL